MSAKKHQAAEAPKDDTKKGLQDVAKKLLVLCTPWPLWIVSGCWIVGASNLPTPGVITATDIAGREILSYVPLPIVKDFLSKTGQSIVSPFPYILLIFANDPNEPGKLRYGCCSVVPHEPSPDTCKPDFWPCV